MDTHHFESFQKLNATHGARYRSKGGIIIFSPFTIGKSEKILAVQTTESHVTLSGEWWREKERVRVKVRARRWRIEDKKGRKEERLRWKRTGRWGREYNVGKDCEVK